MLTAFEILGSLSATGLAYLGLQSYGYGVAVGALEFRISEPPVRDAVAVGLKSQIGKACRRERAEDFECG
ncbi:hypothetical protein, partial [Nocardia gipuzkoensis]|uniref:hypothetical protein n=1 Tax=Nocardia gipuzkoensis TaxID=2749991 RepID=UPI0015EF9C45